MRSISPKPPPGRGAGLVGPAECGGPGGGGGALGGGLGGGGGRGGGGGGGGGPGGAGGGTLGAGLGGGGGRGGAGRGGGAPATGACAGRATGRSLSAPPEPAGLVTSRLVPHLGHRILSPVGGMRFSSIW